MVMQDGVLVAKKEKRGGFGLATFATGIVYGLQVGVLLGEELPLFCVDGAFGWSSALCPLRCTVRRSCRSGCAGLCYAAVRCRPGFCQTNEQQIAALVLIESLPRPALPTPPSPPPAAARRAVCDCARAGAAHQAGGGFLHFHVCAGHRGSHGGLHRHHRWVPKP